MLGALDTNVIIALSKGECLEKLKGIFSVVYTVPSVISEAKDTFSKRALKKIKGSFLIVQSPKILLSPKPLKGLSKADIQILSLAVEKKVDYFLTEDLSLEENAKRYNLKTMRMLEFLKILSKKNLIEDIKTIIFKIQKRGTAVDETILSKP